MQFQDIACVLRVARIEDRHQLVTGLTKTHGIIRAFANNSVHSKRFLSSLEIFSIGEWHLRSRASSTLYRLEAIDFKASFMEFASHALGYYLAHGLHEIALKCRIDANGSRFFFNLHTRALYNLKQQIQSGELTKASGVALISTYAVKSLALLGYQPQGYYCALCQQSAKEGTQVLWNLKQPLWRCQDCAPWEDLTLRLPSWSVRLLQTRLQHSIDAIPLILEWDDECALWNLYESWLVHCVPSFDQGPLKFLEYALIPSGFFRNNKPQTTT